MIQPSVMEDLQRMKAIPVSALVAALIGGLLALPGCASQSDGPANTQMMVASAMVDSLRGGSAITDTNAAPAEKRIVVIEDLIPRTFEEQPPVVPHKTEKYVINRQGNKCLGCHDRPNYKKEDSPKISDSHYRDRDGKELDHLASNRYFCTQCHVTQVDAKPLVENTFQAGK